MRQWGNCVVKPRAKNAGGCVDRCFQSDRLDGYAARLQVKIATESFWKAMRPV